MAYGFWIDITTQQKWEQRTALMSSHLCMSWTSTNACAEPHSTMQEVSRLSAYVVAISTALRRKAEHESELSHSVISNKHGRKQNPPGSREPGGQHITTPSPPLTSPADPASSGTSRASAHRPC